MPTTPQDTRGLHSKFHITRVDFRDVEGAVHDACQYFVLDLTHDAHARAALVTYIESCRADRPVLALDLQSLLNDPGLRKEKPARRS